MTSERLPHERPLEPEVAEPIEREDRAAAQLYEQATRRQSEVAEKPVGFGRQMLQLVLIPALIVGGILAVWLIVISLGGQAQSLESILNRLNTTGGSLPADQERARAALSLLSAIEDATGRYGSPLSPEDRAKLVEQLPAIARLHRGGHEELCRAIMGAIGLLAEPATVPVFAEFLKSGSATDWFAAVSGLHGWRGEMTALRPLTPDLLNVLRRAPRPPANPREDKPIHSLPSITMSVLAVVADPGNMDVRDALNREMQDSTGANRDLAWNAGCALAVLGDERGLPVVMSLLDRAWLSEQFYDPRTPERGRLDRASQRKIIASTVNIVVGFDPRLEGFAVRIEDEGVWSLIAQIAESDPDADIRTLAKAALTAREARVGDDQ